MRIANLDGTRAVATTSGTIAACPGCGDPVRAHCGQVIRPYWAHLSLRTDERCDWFAGETDWHLDWKAAAPPDRQEIAIGRNRADIITPTGIVIELQHSHLAKTDIDQRENAYGRMVWLFDASRPYEEDRLTLRRHPDQQPDDQYRYARWTQASAYPRQVTKPLFLDLGKELLWVGVVRPDTTLGLGGWLVPHDWFKRVVINGQYLPATPRAGRRLTADQIEQEIADPALAVPRGLDWKGHSVGDRRPCRICGRGAFCRDEFGKPCHKVCAEEEAGAAPRQEQPEPAGLTA